MTLTEQRRKKPSEAVEKVMWAWERSVGEGMGGEWSGGEGKRRGRGEEGRRGEGEGMGGEKKGRGGGEEGRRGEGRGVEWRKREGEGEGEGGKGIGGLEKEGRRGEGKHVQLDYQFIITPSQIRGYSTNALDRSKVKVHCLDTNLAWRE